MTDRDVLKRLATLLGVKVLRDYRHTRNPEWKPIYHVRVSGAHAVRLMTRIRPIMDQRRQAQIDRALAARDAAMVGHVQRKFLTPHQREQIAQRLTAGEKANILAAEFGIRREYVYRVAKRVAAVRIP